MVHRNVNASKESGELLLYPTQGQGNPKYQHYSAGTVKRDDALALEQDAQESNPNGPTVNKPKTKQEPRRQLNT